MMLTLIERSRFGLPVGGWIGVPALPGIAPSVGLAVWVVVVSVLTMVLSLGTAVIVLVRLPAEAFIADSRAAPSRRGAALGMLARIGMNVLGWFLVCAGVILSIPGVPGQGLLTIFAGLLLVEFPGRHRLIRKILSRPKTRTWVNRLRARFGQAPLQGNPK
ncbi:MAG TPA: PGPGW domain-containing protein [Planctomycetota bacterium]|nr:PGPGW domain-containing protein [Planctomycetota bacterium]